MRLYINVSRFGYFNIMSNYEPAYFCIQVIKLLHIHIPADNDIPVRETGFQFWKRNKIWIIIYIFDYVKYLELISSNLNNYLREYKIMYFLKPWYMLQMVYLFHNDNDILGKWKVSHKAGRSLILKVVACSFAENY